MEHKQYLNKLTHGISAIALLGTVSCASGVSKEEFSSLSSRVTSIEYNVNQLGKTDFVYKAKMVLLTPKNGDLYESIKQTALSKMHDAAYRDSAKDNANGVLVSQPIKDGKIYLRLVYDTGITGEYEAGIDNKFTDGDKGPDTFPVPESSIDIRVRNMLIQSGK